MSLVYDQAMLSSPGVQRMPVGEADWLSFIRELSKLTCNGFTGARNLGGDPVAFEGMATAAAPAVVAIPGGSTVYARQFSGAAVNELFFTLAIPEWARNDNFTLDFLAHWGPINAGAGNVVWKIDYELSDPGTALAGPATTLGVPGVSVAAGGMADAHIVTSFTSIAGSALATPTAAAGVSGMMLGRLWRNPADAADTYASAAWLWRLEARFTERA